MGLPHRVFPTVPWPPARLWRAALAALALAGALAGCVASEAAAVPAPAPLAAEQSDNSTPLPTVVPAVGSAPSVGAAAPEFALPGTAGETLALADLRGRKVLVNFWATWCGPCREEIPLMIEYQDDLQAAGIELLAVNVGETPAKVARFVADARMNFPGLMDTSTGVAQAYYLRAIPTSYLVDEDGVIEDIHLGILMADDLDAMIAATSE